MSAPLTFFHDTLDAWLDRLDRADFRVGVRERLLVHALMARLAAAGELVPSMPAEEVLLRARPLLCTQAVQQRQYQVLLRQFLQERGAVVEERRPDGGGSGGTSTNPRRVWRSRVWVLVVAAGLLAAGIAATRWWSSQPQRNEPVVGVPPQPPTPSPIPANPAAETSVVVSGPIYVPVSTRSIASPPVTEAPAWTNPLRWMLLAGGALALLALAALTIARWRRQMYLKAARTDREIDERLLSDPKPVSIDLPTGLARRVASTLRRRHAGTRQILDVRATLRATIDAYGGLAPRFTVAQMTPEYVVLVDRRHPSDHHAAYSDTLVAALSRNAVNVHAYEFDGSPEGGCWPQRRFDQRQTARGTIRFPELAARHAGHRLLIFSEAQALLDRVDGRSPSWTGHLNAFPQRAWLTPMPLQSWGPAERVADASGFLVLPIQPDALHTLADWFSAGQLGLAVDSDWPLMFPSLLQAPATAWVSRHTPPPAATLERLLFELRAYLGADRFQWLSACAVFPALTPQVTLLIGSRLSPDARERALGFAAIAALPWFRFGFMPAWLRELLIDRLDPENERQAREVLEERLADAIGGTGAHLATLAWLRRRRGVARDVVMAGFVDRGLTRLAQRLPDGLRRRLFEEGVGAYGPRTAIFALVPIGLLAGLPAAPGVWDRILAATTEPVTLALVQTIEAGQGPIRSVAIAPDGRLIATGGEDGTIRYWDVKTGRDMHGKVGGHAGAVTAITFSRDSLALATAGRDRTVRLWNTLNGEALRSYQVPAQGIGLVTGLNNLDVASLQSDGTIRASSDESRDLELLGRLAHPQPVDAVAVSANGRLLATIAQGTARLWTLDAAVGDNALSGTDVTLPARGVVALSFSPDERYVVTAGGVESAAELIVWAVATGQRVGDAWRTTGRVTSVAFTPDGRHIVASGDAVRVWSTATHDRVAISAAVAHDVSSNVAVGPDGTLIVGGGADGRLRIWGQPPLTRVELVGCATSARVDARTRDLADDLNEAVLAGSVPAVAPVAYGAATWSDLARQRYPDSGLLLVNSRSGVPSGAPTLVSWLRARKGYDALSLRTFRTDYLADGTFVVNTCTPAGSPDGATAPVVIPSARFRIRLFIDRNADPVSVNRVRTLLQQAGADVATTRTVVGSSDRPTAEVRYASTASRELAARVLRVLDVGAIRAVLREMPGSDASYDVSLWLSLPVVVPEPQRPAVARLGDRGQTVVGIQQALVRAGYPEPEKLGYFDKRTAEYVRKFQQVNGLDPSGVVDEPTLERLIAVRGRPTGGRSGQQDAPPPPTLSYTQFAEYVRELGDMRFATNSAIEPRTTFRGGQPIDIEVEKLLRECPSCGIRLVGHTSPREGASDEDRRQLSMRRAATVRNLLLSELRSFLERWTPVARAELDARLVTAGVGDTQSICDKQDALQSCEQDQRVELQPFALTATR